MNCVFLQTLRTNLLLLLVGVALLAAPHSVVAQFNPEINYQGKLTNGSGVAVPDGTYNMNFWLVPTSGGATSTAVWSEARTGANVVQVTDGLFSVMLGEVSTLGAVDFNQTLYLAVEIGGTGTPAWDGEMLPRKVLGAVPAAFVAETADNALALGGVASSSFLRSDEVDTMTASSSSSLLTLVQNGIGKILSLFSGATEVFTVLNNGNVGVGTTTPSSDLTVVGDAFVTGAFRDSTNAAGTDGYVLQTTGAGTEWVATSSLGFPAGISTFLGLTDTPSSFTANRIMFTNSGGTALTDTSTFVFDGTNLGIGINAPSANLHVNSGAGAGDAEVRTSWTDTTAEGGLMFYQGSNFYGGVEVFGSSFATTTYRNSLMLTAARSDLGSIIFRTMTSGAYQERMMITNGGSVGIGTTTPSSKLSVIGDIYATGAFRDSTNAAGTAGRILQTTGTGTQWVATSSLGITGVSTFLGLTDTPSSFTANRIMFTNSGGTALTDTSTFVFDGTNLGIGTTTPASNLHVHTNAGNSLIRTSWTDTTAEGGLIFYEGSNYRGGVEVMGSAFATSLWRNALLLTAATNDLGSIIFRTRTSNAYVERMIVTNDGNVGIGTTTPSSKLSVIGDIYATGAFRDSTNSAGTNGMVLRTSGTGSSWVATSTLGLSASFTTSAQLAALLSDEQGTGAAVFANSPTFTGTPVLPSSFTMGSDTFGRVGAHSLLFVTSGITSVTLPTSGTLYGTAAGSITSAQLLGSLSNETGTGVAVFNDSPTIAGTLAGASATFSGTLGVTGTSTLATTTITDLTLAGAFRDSTNSAGTSGYVLQTNGTSTEWVATSSLGFSSGASTFLALTDTPSSFTANRIMFTNTGATALTDSADLTYDGTNLGLGGTNGIAFGGTRYITASTTNDSITFGENAGANFSDLTTFNNAIGYQAGLYASTTNVDYNNLIGYQAGYSNTGSSNNIFGYIAGSSNTGVTNNIIGYQAGSNNTGSTNNIIGSNTGSSNTGSNNNLMGVLAGASNTGSYNNFIGYWAGRTNTGSYNNFTGFRAGYVNNGDMNEMIGYQTGRYIQSTSSVLVGAEAFYGGSTFQAINNVALGYRAGYAASTGANNNILLGYQAADNLTTGANNIVLGYDVDIASTTGSNQLNIGNIIFGTGIDGTGTTLSSGNIGIGTTTPSSKLTIAGDIFATGALRDSTNSAGTAGMVLQTTGTGTEWVATSSLGISGGASTFLALTDTPSSFTANRIMFTNSGGTALTDTANFVFDGTNLGVGTTTPNNLIQVYDLIEFNNAQFRTQLGYQAGKNLVSGAVNNTFVGYQAGYSSSTGSTSGADYNTAIGYSAFLSNTSGNSNVAVGAGSLQNNTTGSSNNAVGVNSLYSNTTGASNVAFGLDALRSNISGWYNIAIGQAALYTNTDSWYNTAIGYEALRFNTTGQSNTAIGYNALRSNISGQHNIANGYETLYSNTSGSVNTAIGNFALRSNTTGDYNTALGYQAGRYLTDGTSAASTTDRSIYIGYNTKALTSNDLNSIVIGYDANGLGSNTVVLGNDSVVTTALKGNIGIGTTTPSSKLTVVGDTYISGGLTLTGVFNDSTNASGTIGMVLQATGTSTRWVATSTLGFSSGGSLFTDAGAETYLTATGDNLAVGTTTAGSKLTVDGDIRLTGGINFGAERVLFKDDADNVMFGSFALTYNENADVYSNTVIGNSAAGPLQFGFSNTFVGFSAGSNIATGSRSVILGNQAAGAGNGNADIGEMVIIGDGAGFDLASGGGFGTFVGYRAGENVTTGSNNTLLGYRAGDNLTTGYNNIIIGNDIEALSAGVDSTLNIGNLLFGTGIDGTGTTLSSGNIGIGTTTPSSKLTIAGDIFATGAFRDSTNASGTAGMVLQTTGTGTQWVATSSLGIGDGTFLGLTDTPSSFTANRIMFTNSGATALTDSANLTYDGTNLGLGGTNGIAFNGTRYITASTTNGSITFGVNAGATITSGATNNIAIGLEAGRYASTTAADNNVYIGNFAGQNNNDNYNVIIGDTAGQWNTGDNSVLLGTAAGASNTGISNNIVGNWAGKNNTGDYNNIMGWESGLNNTGSYAFLAGYEAGQDNAGNDVILIGHQAGMVNTGDDNIFLGDIAGKNNTNGFGNSFMGYMSGFRNTTGDYNLLLGWQAGADINGDNNIALGQDAFGGNGVAAFTASNNIAIGYAAGFNADTNANNNILIGYAAADNLTSGANNIVIGYDVDIASTTRSNQLNIGNIIFGTGIDGTGTTLSTGNIGIGTSTLSSKFTIQGTAGSNIFTIASSTGTSLLTVNQSGYLGIGTTSPAYPLDVYLGTANAIRVKSDDAYSLVVFEDNTTSAGQVAAGTLGNDFQIFTGGTDRLTVLQAGNVGIGTSSPAQKLQVIGDIRVGTTGTNGCVQRFDGTAIAGTCSSDEQLKTDITPLSNSTTTRNYLEGMTSLTPVTYKWNEVAAELYKNGTTTTSIGLIAQDIELVFPELVSLDDKGYRQVNFNAFTFYIMQAMKEFYSDFLVLKDTVAGFTDLFISKEIQTEKLCVEGVCITATELSELLQGTSGGGPASTPAAETPPTDDQGGEAGGEEVITPPEDGGAETATTTDSGTEPEPDMTTSAPSEVVEEPPASAEPEPEVVEEPAEPEPEPESEPEPVAEPPAPTESEPGPEIGG